MKAAWRVTDQACDLEIGWSDDDVVEPGDYQMGWPAWLLHDHGFSVAVVFADNIQDALDEGADSGKMDRYKVSPEQMGDYGPDEEGLDFLGNGSEPFDIQTMGVECLGVIPFSFAALYMAYRAETEGS